MRAQRSAAAMHTDYDHDRPPLVHDRPQPGPGDLPQRRSRCYRAIIHLSWLISFSTKTAPKVIGACQGRSRLIAPFRGAVNPPGKHRTVSFPPAPTAVDPELRM